MLLVTDVHYLQEGGARAAGIVLDDWADENVGRHHLSHIDRVEPYVTGEFYRRELPCLLPLVEQAGSAITYIIVDGHVWLGDEPGLGAYLHRAIGMPVVGIAKNAHIAGGTVAVFRGQSETPLHVSAVGIDVEVACAGLRAMHGPYRLPTALKRVDRLARDGQ